MAQTVKRDPMEQIVLNAMQSASEITKKYAIELVKLTLNECARKDDDHGEYICMRIIEDLKNHLH